MSHVLAFVFGFAACFAWVMWMAFGPIRIKWKRNVVDEPEPFSDAEWGLVP